MKLYSIDTIWGAVFSESHIVEGKNSKDALEKHLGKKVIRDEKYPKYSVVECDKEGRLHYDRRKWIYYKIKLNN